jgi:hypothetical protein
MTKAMCNGRACSGHLDVRDSTAYVLQAAWPLMLQLHMSIYARDILPNLAVRSRASFVTQSAKSRPQSLVLYALLTSVTNTADGPLRQVDK